jgi:catechol 2,3-dioxygenase-like lactoylglutathione lyase family enzyme
MDSHQLIRTFHSTCMVNDYDATIAALGRLAGLRVLEYSALEYVGRRGGMTWIGDNSLEVGEPIVEGHSVERFLHRYGPGMHSYAFQVADLEATIGHLGAEGIAVGSRPGPTFCFTDPRTTGGLLFEWSNKTAQEDPRIGAPVPPYLTEPLLDVRTHAFVGALVPDPVDWAVKYGPILGLVEAFHNPGSGLGEPVVGLAAPDCILALYRLPGNESRALWGAEYSRPRFHVLGLGVGDLQEAVQALVRAEIPLIRQTDQAVVPDPKATGEVSVMLVDSLLPGDPRRH